MDVLFVVGRRHEFGGILETIGTFKNLVVNKIRVIAQFLQIGNVAERRQTGVNLSFFCGKMGTKNQLSESH